MAVLVLYFLSGAAGLVFETVFLRQATWSFGSASLATAITLSAFMAGLALGSAAGGRLADRVARPLALYGAIEIATGAAGALLAWLLGSARETAILPLLPSAATWRQPVELALAFALLLVPASLLGASLPAIARFRIAAPERVVGPLGALFALNTLGAAAGTLLAGFALFERVGVSGSAYLAAALDVLVGATALALDRAWAAPSRPRPPAEPPRPPSEPLSPALRRACFAAVATGGFASLGYEVVWTRLLALPMRSYAYSFSLMLALFLSGLVLGYGLIALLSPRVRDLPRALAWASLGGGAWVAASVLWLPAILVPSEASGFGPYLALSSLKAALLVVPPTLGSGIVLPLAAAAIARDARGLGRGVGAVLAANTAGAVAGPIGAGLLFLPALGAPASLALLASIQATGGALVLASSGARGPRRLLGAALAASCLLPAAVPDGRYVGAFLAASRGRETIASVLEFHEGAADTIAVVRKDYGYLDPDAKSLITNGIAMSATVLPVRRYMALEGHLPVLLAPSPSRVAVICLGTGITLGAVASHPSLRRIDGVELSDGVLRALPAFAAESGEPWKDPRVRLVREDGRHFLESANAPYDAITLEPPPPIVAGAVHLYSLEFYRTCRKRLSTGGIVAQWLPLHAQSLDSARMVARTFLEAFPYAELWLPSIRDAVLVGSDRPIRLDLARLEEAYATPSTLASLRGALVETPEALLATRLADRAGIERFAAGAPPVTDDRPRIEFFRTQGSIMKDPDIRALLDAAGERPPPLGGLDSDPDLAARVAEESGAFRAYLESEVRNDLGLALEAARRSRGTGFFLYRLGCEPRQIERARGEAKDHPEVAAALERCDAWFGRKAAGGDPRWR